MTFTTKELENMDNYDLIRNVRDMFRGTTSYEGNPVNIYYELCNRLEKAQEVIDSLDIIE